MTLGGFFFVTSPNVTPKLIFKKMTRTGRRCNRRNRARRMFQEGKLSKKELKMLPELDWYVAKLPSRVHIRHMRRWRI